MPHSSDQLLSRVSRRSDRMRLLIFVLLSAGVHLLLSLIGIFDSPPLSVVPFTDVELVSGASDGTAPSAREQGAPERARAAPRQGSVEKRARVASGRRRASTPPGRAPASGGADSQGATPPGVPERCVLAMRDCGPAGEPASIAPRRDRLWSFSTRRGEARSGESTPAVRDRVAHGGVEAVNYDDGGRLLRNTGGSGKAPGAGTVGLLTLASTRIGDSIGRTACDPYRDWRPAGERHLVLLVDTSGSIVSSRQVPAAIVCAAGAALSGLSRGFAVTVANFSRETIYYQTSRSSEVIYSAISRVQGETTILPRLSLLPLRGGHARDYVLISDAEIHNLKEVLPDYQRSFQREPDSRALLFVLGEGRQQKVASLESAGFRSDQVEGPGRDFKRYAVRILEGVTPLRQLSRLRQAAGRIPTTPARPAARKDSSTGPPPVL